MLNTIAQIPPRVETALREFSEYARRAPGNRVEKLVLFGSYARGDFRGDSDVDVLAIVDRRDSGLLDYLYDGTLDALLKHRVDISLKVVPAAAYAEIAARREPIAVALDREGRVFWIKTSETV